MKRGDKVVIYVDMLGFARLTEEWPRRIIHRRKGQWRSRGTSEANNQLVMFHSVFDQMVQEFGRMSNLMAMSFSDSAFALVGSAYLSAEFAVELMQHFIRANVPVRIGIAAGTFWPGRQTSDLIGESAISRAIFHGTAIVRAHKAESNGLAGMRIFVHESLDDVVTRLGPRPFLRFPAKTNGVVGELSYLYHDTQYRDATRSSTVEEDDRLLWSGVSFLKSNVSGNAPRRVHQQYLQTLAALQRMRQLSGRAKFRRRQWS